MGSAAPDQISNISFCEHQEPAGPSALSPSAPQAAHSPLPAENGNLPSPRRAAAAAAGTGGGVQRMCVLEANVINRTELALQVGHGMVNQAIETHGSSATETPHC